MEERRARILNQEGLHARLAARLVKCATQFQSKITLFKGKQQADATSIMGILILAAGPGTELAIHAEGVDELQAAASIQRLIDSRFETEE